MRIPATSKMGNVREGRDRERNQRDNDNEQL